jgi:hypothetical protein
MNDKKIYIQKKNFHSITYSLYIKKSPISNFCMYPIYTLHNIIRSKFKEILKNKIYI